MPDLTSPSAVPGELTETSDLIELAWGLIANASSGNWERESKAWQDAAVTWRKLYHAWLSERVPAPAPAPAAGSETWIAEIRERVNAAALGPQPWDDVPYLLAALDALRTENERLREAANRTVIALGFFACHIKAGEPWGADCEAVMQSLRAPRAHVHRSPER